MTFIRMFEHEISWLGKPNLLWPTVVTVHCPGTLLCLWPPMNQYFISTSFKFIETPNLVEENQISQNRTTSFESNRCYKILKCMSVMIGSASSMSNKPYIYIHCHINLHTKMNIYAPLSRFVIVKISHRHAVQGRESSEEPIITSKHNIYFFLIIHTQNHI